MIRTRILQNPILFIMALLCLHCGPRNEDESAEASDFEGIQTITQNPNGTFTLTWPVAFSSETRYLIYQAPEGEAFDFEKPYFSTLETQHTTDVLIFHPAVCFVVRVSTDNLVTDTNTKSLCTTSNGIEGTGFYPLEDPAKNNGKVTLSWPSINLPGAKFTIYERYKKRGGIDVDETYKDPLTTTATTLYDAGITDRGSIRCFKLEVSIPDDIGLNQADFNSEAELCTDPFYENPFGFAGVQSVYYAYCDSPANLSTKAPTLEQLITPNELTNCVDYQREDWPTPPSTGDNGLIVSWTHDDTNSAISGYEIFLGSGFDTKITCILPSTASEQEKSEFSQCLIVEPSSTGVMALGVYQGISEEVSYHFGVKAFDSYGRYDDNIKTIPIKAKALDGIY